MESSQANSDPLSQEKVKKLIVLAVQASLEAGAAILDIYSTDFSIEEKEDHSPLTTADKRSNVIITDYLEKEIFPILSEEGKATSFEERSEWDTFWCVDPLDGTKEFIKHNGEFTVNIALIRLGKPVLGVIYVPVTNELYFSAAGLGAFKIPKANEVIKESLLVLDDGYNLLQENASVLPLKIEHDQFTVVASRSHLSPETEEYINGLRTKHGEVEIISKGSSLKICMVAEGKADVYPRFGPTMEWDTAAGQALVEAAGGKLMVHPDNIPLRYNKEDLLNPYFIVFK